MEQRHEPAGVPASSPRPSGGQRPVFICYRQFDGRRYASWIHSALTEGFKARADDTLVYFDQTAPAASDWTTIHRPALERAGCLIVIATPGLYGEVRNDWVHQELDWWLKHRNTAPILVDPTGEGERWIPQKIKSRWPRAQRINLDPDLWAQEKEEEQERNRAQVFEQIIGSIKGSRFAVVAQDLARAHRVRRFTSVAGFAGVVGGLLYLVYLQTARYQIETIIKSAREGVRFVAENNWDPNSAESVCGCLRALAAYRPEEVFRMASQIPWLWGRVEAFVAIAKGQADAGHQPEAVRALEEAQRIAHEIPDAYSLITALVNIAEGQAVAGPQAEAGHTLEEAHRTALEIPYADNQRQALLLIAEGRSKLGQKAEAAEVLREAERLAREMADPADPRPQMMALYSVAVGQAQAGQFAEAEHITRDIQEPDIQLQALMFIAQERAKAGQTREEVGKTWEEAWRTVQAMENPYQKSQGLTLLVIAHADAGQFLRLERAIDELERTVRHIPDRESKDQWIGSIAGAWAKAGQLKEAERTAERILDPYWKNTTFVWIVEAEAKAARFAGLERTIERITDQNLKDAAVVALARGQAQAGRIADAMRTLRQIPDTLKGEPLLSIAEVQAKAGHWRAARAAADRCPPIPKLKAYAAILTEYVRPKGLHFETRAPLSRQETEVLSAAPSL